MSLVVLPAVAASNSGDFSLKGVGYNKCADFVSAKAGGRSDYLQYLGWLEGYLSFYNRVTPDTINIAPWESTDLLASLLENYCKDNGQTPYVVAVDLMIKELVPQRLKESSELVSITRGGRTVTVYREVLRSAQTKLAERKLYGGLRNGVFSDEVSTAIVAFQKSAKLDLTGIPDQATLYHLLLKAR